jgi:hypothetical protein
MKRSLGFAVLFLLVVFALSAQFDEYEVIERVSYDEDSEFIIRSNSAGTIVMDSEEFAMVFFEEERQEFIDLLELNLELINVAESENTTVQFRRQTGSIGTDNEIRISTAFFTNGRGYNVIFMGLSDSFDSEEMILDGEEAQNLLNAVSGVQDQTDDFREQVRRFQEIIDQAQ